MDNDEAITALQKAPSKFNEKTARAYVRARGQCEYCDKYLIKDRLHYASTHIDHLLCRRWYTEDISELPDNYVLSCSLCNGLKGQYVVLNVGEDPIAMLSSQRSVLIGRAKEYINRKREEADVAWSSVKDVFDGMGIK